MKKSTLFGISMVVLSAFAAPAASAFDSITPPQAYSLVASQPNYYIIDVRTPQEWRWVGHPGKNGMGEGAALDGKVVNVAYMIDQKDSYIVNPTFVSEINELFGNAKQDVVLVLLCRSGVRSVAAANLLEPLGYQVVNVLHGFQGEGDARGYRVVEGWMNEGLPYNQKTAGMYAD